MKTAVKTVGRPKDLEKRAAILEAAKRLFLSGGFEGTSMDAVAAEAGVSKLTVYNHFKDKETLFIEAVKAKCEEQLPHDAFEVNPKAGVRAQLTAIARGFFALVNSPESIAIHRMISAESARQADSTLGQLFLEAGPKRTVGELELFLRAENAKGLLDVPDPARAAQHFFCMLKGIYHMKLLCGCMTPVDPKEVEAHIASVVDLFLRAFLPR